MFDFLDSDWFIITLEILFLIFIAYDLKKYFETKKKEYITNIVLTIGFAIWTLLPFYNSYFKWDDAQKQELIASCALKEVPLGYQKENNATVCKCLSDKTFKEYGFDEYKVLDKNGSEYKEFVKETIEECLDDSWF